MLEILKKLKFDAQGLIPAIAQDEKTNQVLMMAWMNEESLELTLTSGYATYFSRSRKALWKKGDTSGHLQQVVSIRTDCDFDCILLKVKQTGVACHTGEMSCFFNEIL
jgi:phosphoribosyl-ATP pyrophosphohydrolase/phosphoribosyl-AMP cyclohydrolase